MRFRLPRPARRTLLIGLGVLLGVTGVVLALAVSINTPIDRLVGPGDVPPAGSPAFLRLIELHTDVAFAPGHAVELALDGGGTYPRLWRDLSAARASINFQVYYCQPGSLADTLGAVLAERARAGVVVRVLYDGFGCAPIGDDWVEGLRAAGADVRSFRPVKWWSLHKAQERSHARIVVIDGAVGWTGGFAIDDRWSAAGAEGEPAWRDTNARVTGPAVATLQAAFADGWAETTGELLVAPALFGLAAPDTTATGGSTAALLHSVPDEGSTTAERLLALTAAGARRSLFITNAYFVPDDDFRAMLVEAAGRGVDVRVLTPGEWTDMPMVRWAARANYSELLDGGVRVWEYAPAMIHAKTFVADGAWTSIGSMNFDNRSIAVNDETTLLVADPALGQAMERLFLEDLQRATELTPETFGERGAWERIRERFAVLASRFL